MTLTVVEISAVETHPLRRAVLRDGTVDAVVTFDDDDRPGVVHLGVRDDDGVIVAVSTWIPRPYDDEAAVQLRGMATDHRLQGTGIGGVLLEAGCARASATVWARGRDAALAFYSRHGFVVEGDGFVDATTQLPHHLIVRRVAR